MHDPWRESSGVTGRLSWLEPIATQIAAEAGLGCNAAIEDLVVLAFEGLLNDPAVHGDVTHARLLSRARHDLTVWVREQDLDRAQLPLPVAAEVGHEVRP